CIAVSRTLASAAGSLPGAAAWALPVVAIPPSRLAARRVRAGRRVRRFMRLSLLAVEMTETITQSPPFLETYCRKYTPTTAQERLTKPEGKGCGPPTHRRSGGPRRQYFSTARRMQRRHRALS